MKVKIKQAPGVPVTMHYFTDDGAYLWTETKVFSWPTREEMRDDVPVYVPRDSAEGVAAAFTQGSNLEKHERAQLARLKAKYDDLVFDR